MEIPINKFPFSATELCLQTDSDESLKEILSFKNPANASPDMGIQIYPSREVFLGSHIIKAETVSSSPNEI